jgi:predicted N-acetyltransferase YhbS
MNNIKLRPGTPKDGSLCGKICFDAFNSIAKQHNFPSEFPLLTPTKEIISSLLSNQGFYSVIAEIEGEIVGSNFLDERGTIVGLGPISIDPNKQNLGIGRQLMQNVVDRATSQGYPGIRLNTAAHHTRSLSLYTKIGFKIRQPIVIMQGSQIKCKIANAIVRTAHSTDIDSIDQLCEKVHGHNRRQEMIEAIGQGTAKVVERGGRVTGYTSEVSFFGHSVGETNDDIKALIASTKEFKGAGFLLPSTNHELLMWCLNNNLKVVMSMVHMTLGLYNYPQGAYLPGILY